MARYKNKTKDLAELFTLWLVQPSGGKGFASTRFYAAAQHGTSQATCLLDYLLIWILTTDDALRFENFSQWKAVIRRLDRNFTRGARGLRLAAQIEELTNCAARGVKVFDGSLPLTDNAQAVTHPALDDLIFDLIVLQQHLRSGLVDGISDEEALKGDREMAEEILELLAEYYSDTNVFAAE